MASYDSGFDGTGTYHLAVAHTRPTISVSPGDAGGPLTNGVTHTGTIVRGDPDVWTLQANAGDLVDINLTQIGQRDVLVLVRPTTPDSTGRARST